MHTCNLGLYLVVDAEGLLMLARAMPCDLANALRETYAMFKRFCSTNKIFTSQRIWKESTFNMNNKVENYPWLKAKAFNARVILGWLSVPCF